MSRFLLAIVLVSTQGAQDRDALLRLESARQLKRQNSLKAAYQAYESTLPALRAARDRNLLAHALFETGQTALALGDYRHAIDRAAESAAIFHDQGDVSNEALATNYVGSARLNRGEYDAALQSFEHALDLDRRQHDGNGEATRLSNIGNVYFFQGKYLDALQSYQSALRRVDQAPGEPWYGRRRQLVLANLAALYEQLGQNERALEYYKLAQAAGAALPPSEYAQLLSNMGTLYRRLGDPVKALETYQAAQQLFLRQQDSDGQTHILQNIGIVFALDIKNPARALTAFTQALKLSGATANRRETVLAHLFRGEALYRMDRLDGARLDFAAALSGARAIGAAEEQWTAQYGLGRIYRRGGNDAEAMDAFQQAIASIESVRSGLGAGSLKSEFLANKRDVYDACIEIQLRRGASDHQQLFGLFEKARSRNLQDTLRHKMALPSIRSLQTRLGSGSLLVEYWLGSDQVAALWITKYGSGVVRRPLTPGDVSAIRDLATVLQDAVDSRWRSQAERAGELLLAGIPLGAIPLNNDTANLLIVPDGLLDSVPFELLAVNRGAPLVMEQFAVSYLPSAALILSHTEPPRTAPPWKRQLVAFGDPIMPAGGPLPIDGRWSRLPDSARELRSIASAVRGRTEIHAGPNNLKAVLAGGRAAGAPLLHFSTHAAVDALDPNRSRILFTPESGKKGSEYLFLREVQALPLSGVELVTLSACETEGGKLVRGEGVQSFSRAFLSAGATSTVTTLWRVADGPTADFMQLFYQHLARGETKAQALRAAKLSFLRSGRELAQPRYWAAFVLNGDGRIPVRPVLSLAWILGPVGVILLLSFLFRRHRFPWERVEAVAPER